MRNKVETFFAAKVDAENKEKRRNDKKKMECFWETIFASAEK